MPPASSSQSSAARNARSARNSQDTVSGPRQVTQRLPRSKIGWDRKFRVVLAVALCVIGWFGVRAGIALFSARTQQAQEAALLSSLETQHRHLVAQERSLKQPATLMRDARALGMVRAGERSYSIIGLSSH